MADPEQSHDSATIWASVCPSDKWERRGQIAGALVSDVVQDRGRSIWWLLNAPQAAANVIQEGLLHRYGSSDIYQSNLASKVLKVSAVQSERPKIKKTIDYLVPTKATWVQQTGETHSRCHH